jgi:hypothetical protein
MSDFDHFFGVAPSDQNALDLFAGEWSSKPPPTRPDVEAGDTPLYEDPRISWAQEQLGDMGLSGGFTGRDVLELGPLEGGHTYLLDRLEAGSITAVEANARCYLKCLIAKEVFGIARARFLLGDGLEYLRATDRRFDVGVAYGILYHQTSPVELLEMLSRRCDALVLWTVYYDPDFVAEHPGPAAMFSETAELEHAGFEHTVHRWNYGPQLDSDAFSGGGASYSHWMERPEILAALRHFGFTDLRTEDQENPFGAALLLVARK